jgi:hypothetical protein
MSDNKGKILPQLPFTVGDKSHDFFLLPVIEITYRCDQQTVNRCELNCARQEDLRGGGK